MTKLVRGPARFTLAASGYIADVTNSASRNKRNFWTDGELDGPEQQLKTPREGPGSW